jgi:hypothetical protein
MSWVAIALADCRSECEWEETLELIPCLTESVNGQKCSMNLSWYVLMECHGENPASSLPPTGRSLLPQAKTSAPDGRTVRLG